MQRTICKLFLVAFVLSQVPAAQAAVTVSPDKPASFRAQVCSTPPEWRGDELVDGAGCSTVTLYNHDDGVVVDVAGYVYETECSSGVSGGSGGLGMVPRECAYIATGDRVSVTAPGAPAATTDTAAPSPAAPTDTTSDPADARPGGIVPACREGEEDCATPYAPENYGPCELVSTFSNVLRFLVAIVGILAVIVVVYVGFLYLTSQGNPSRLAKGKEMFINVVVGFVIALSAYLIVNTIMAVLVGDDSSFMKWDAIDCAYEVETGDAKYGLTVTPHEEDALFDPRVMSKDEKVYNDAIIRSLGGESYKSGDCSPENLERLGMNSTQAKVFSCIARPESGCNQNADNPKSTARGVFQVLRGYDNKCHNLNLSACTAAAKKAGYSVSGNLNCSDAFSGGYRKPGKNTLADACDAAASDMACNVAATLCLYNGEDGGSGGYKPWLGVPGKAHHKSQKACVAKYAE